MIQTHSSAGIAQNPLLCVRILAFRFDYQTEPNTFLILS